MKVDNNMLLLIGALAVGGGVLYYVTREKPVQPQQQVPQQVQAAVEAQAAALGVTNQNQLAQMMSMFQSALSSHGGDINQALQSQQLISGYVNMGLGAAQAIASTISSLAMAFG
jgi:hypothetical protein